MALGSMTGFARSNGALEGMTWAWELRSVNGRGLDVRMRLAPGYEALEARVREAASRRFQRGNIQVNLTVRSAGGAPEIRLNQAALGQLLRAVEEAREAYGLERPRLDGLLQIRGVLEIAEQEDDEAAMLAKHAAMTNSLEAAFDALGQARSGEGRRLEAILAEQLDRIEALTAAAAASPSRSAEAIRSRLADQVGRLVRDAGQLDEARLYQEAALIAARADIEEELKRLTSHIAAVRELLRSGGGIGRQLEFLAQEFHREANTLCSKSIDVEITRIGLALKLVIDQMREQVQNIE